MQIRKILQKIKSKAKMVGVDINSNSIRLVELSNFGSGYKVEKCMSVALAANASDSVIVAALKSIFAQLQLTKNVAIALPHSALFFHEIKIEQNLSERELEDFLQFNIEKYTNESASNINFDYQIIKSPKQINDDILVRLIVVRCEQIEKSIKLLQQADLYPKIIDVDSYAVERVVRKQLKEITELIAIINIENDAILIVIIDHEKIVYTNKEMANPETMQSVKQIIRQIKAKLQQPIEKIVLAGEKSDLVGLSEAISMEFNIRTVVIDPFLGMKLSSVVSKELKQIKFSAMLISCGLAMRVSDDSWY
jgi:type IV pilus assembly protein PilM